MKYSEYLQLRELIEKQQELEKDEIHLNEGLLGNLFRWGGKTLWELIKKGAKTAISSGIESEFKTKLDQDAKTIKQTLIQKLNIKNPPEEGDKNNEELQGGDEVLQKLDQESDAMIKAVKDKNPSADDEAIRKKVFSSRDKKVIQYMEKVLKNQSDVVLKSIEDKEKLEKEDKENLKLYWESKMTVLEIELSMLLAQNGYIEEDNLSSFFDVWETKMKNRV